MAHSGVLISKLESQTGVTGALGLDEIRHVLKHPSPLPTAFSGLCRHAALWSERLLPPRHEFPQRHVQPPPAGSPASPACPRLQAIGACPHPGRETGW